MDGQKFLTEFLEAGRATVAQDTMKDGFATLVDSEGQPYVANLNPKEKERYEETKKPLSKVKKEKGEEGKKEPESQKTEEKKKPEAEKKGGAEVIELHPEIKKTDKKTGLFSTLYGRGNDVILDIAKRENPTLSDAEVNEIIKKSPVNSPVFTDRQKRAEELMDKVKGESWYKEFARHLDGNFAKMVGYYTRARPSEEFAQKTTNEIDRQLNELDRYLKDPKKYNSEGLQIQKDLKDLQDKLEEKKLQIGKLPRSRENTTAYNKAHKAIMALSRSTEFDVRPVTNGSRLRKRGIDVDIVEATSDLSGLEGMKNMTQKLLNGLNKKYPSDSMAQDSLDTFLKNISVEER